MADYFGTRTGAQIDQAVAEVNDAGNTVVARLTGDGPPTSSTVGRVGDMWTNRSTGTGYRCVSADNGVYTWISLNSGGGGGNTDIIAPEWSGSTTYAAGQCVTSSGKLWKCILQHSGETPSEGTYWTEITVSKGLFFGATTLLAESTSVKTTDTEIILSESYNNFTFLYIQIQYNYSTASNVSITSKMIPVDTIILNVTYEPYRVVGAGTSDAMALLKLTFESDTEIIASKGSVTYDGCRHLWIYGIR